MRSPNHLSQQAYRCQGKPGSACWIDHVATTRRGEGHAAIRTALEAEGLRALPHGKCRPAPAEFLRITPERRDDDEI